jgi:hypothetical protein
MSNIKYLCVFIALCICVIPVLGEGKETLLTKDSIKTNVLYKYVISDVKETDLKETTIGDELHYQVILSDLNDKLISRIHYDTIQVDGLGIVTIQKSEKVTVLQLDNLPTLLSDNGIISVLNLDEKLPSIDKLSYLSQVTEDQVVADNGRAIIPKSSKLYGITTSKDNPYQYGTEEWYNYEVTQHV